MPVSASSAQRHACSTARGQSIGSSASFSSDSVYSRHPVRLVLQQNHAKRRWPAHSHCRHVNCSVSCSLSIAACRRCYGAAAALAALLAASPASADVEELFTRNCAGCHAGGGNVIQAGAALSSGDLKKNGVDDPKALFDLVYKGKGRMPGYGLNCAPKGQCTFGKRLDDEQVQQLADYTLQQGAAGWK